MNPTISLTPSGDISLTIPSNHVEGAHSVTIPLSIPGLKLLKKILTERQRSPSARISEPASPVQAQVNAWLAQERLDRMREAEEEKKKKLIAELDITGLDLSALDL